MRTLPMAQRERWLASVLAIVAVTLLPARDSGAGSRTMCDFEPFYSGKSISCGGNNQFDCGSSCDPGNRRLTGAFVSGLPLTFDCPSIVPDETIDGVCTRCGGEGQISCAGGVCNAGLVLARSSDLDAGTIGVCQEALPSTGGPPSSMSVPSGVDINGTVSYTTLSFPSLVRFVDNYGACSDAAPANLAADMSREAWPPTSDPQHGGPRSSSSTAAAEAATAGATPWRRRSIRVTTWSTASSTRRARRRTSAPYACCP